MKHIYLLNGPNLNMLGLREPDIYGKTTLAELEHQLIRHANAKEKATLVPAQYNDEAKMLDAIHAIFHEPNAVGLIINPGGWTHTSVALRDALAMLSIPIVEVHISNIHAREAFRQQSYVSGVATGVICGLGLSGYHLALDFLLSKIDK
jgi:3-dehydroquinate dehydratase-2